jgi:hypothetical protein
VAVVARAVVAVAQVEVADQHYLCMLHRHRRSPFDNNIFTNGNHYHHRDFNRE